MKPLLPTLKEKKRYLAYEIATQAPLRVDCSRTLIQEIKRMLGLFDSAAAGLQSISYDLGKQQGVLRIATRSVPKVRAALTLITHVNNIDVRITTKGVSGILRKVPQEV